MTTQILIHEVGACQYSPPSIPAHLQHRLRPNEANWMDPADYIADLEGEARTLRGRVVELEEELQQVREELRVACERKVEEVTVPSDFHSEGVDGD